MRMARECYVYQPVGCRSSPASVPDAVRKDRDRRNDDEVLGVTLKLDSTS